VSFQISDNDVAPTVGTAVSATIGSSSAGFSVPFVAQATDAKSQMLYTADELRQRGLGAGPVTRIGFNISTRNSTGTYNNFQIRIGHTTKSSLRDQGFQDGLTTVYYTSAYSAVTGANDFQLNAPFTWNGRDNLLVELCYDNTGITPAEGASVNDFTSVTNLGFFNDANTPVRFIWAAGSGSTLNCSSIGTSLTTSQSSGGICYRPVLRIGGSSPSTIVASGLVAGTVYLAPFADLYIYDINDELIARLKNNTAHDYGCTEFRIDRAGTSAKAFNNNSAVNFVADKTLVVTPANNNPNGELEITLYYSATEMGGWVAATGNNVQSIQVVKTKNAVTTYAPGTVPPADLEISPSPVLGSLGSATTVRGAFRTGLSGFGVGFLYTGNYVFTGNGNWSHPANWQGGVVPPPLVPAGFTITIDHVEGGEAVMDIPVTLQPNARITVMPGKRLRLNP
jgi:hypothetical protein